MIRIFTSILFWFMLVHFGLLVGLVAFNLKYLFMPFRNISWKIWLLLFLIFLVGFYLRNSEYWLGTHTDGYVSQEAAHYWLVQGKFVKGCALGNVYNCKLYQQVLAPPGFPFLIAFFSLFSGFHSLNASIISAILSSLTIILTFLIAYLIFRKEDIGLAASLIFSFIPLNILESQSGASRPSGLFFTGLAVFIYLIAVTNKFKLKLWLLVVFCVSYCIYIRQESYILVPFFLTFIPIFKWQILVNWINKIKQHVLKTDDFFSFFQCIEKKLLIRTLVIFVAFIFLQLPVLHWLLFNNPFNTYNAPGIFSLYYKNIFIQAPAMLKQLFNLNDYIFFVSLLFLIGFFLLFLSKSIKSFFVVSLFLAYFFLYASMSHINLFLPGVRLTNDFIRRSLMYHLPYSIIAAYPVNFIAKGKKIFLSFLFIYHLFLTHIPFSSLLKSYTLFKDARIDKIFNLPSEDRDVEYFLATARTPNDCLIITTKFMIVTNDYFKNNQREVVDIELIHPDRHDLFLDNLKQKIKAGKIVLYFDDCYQDSYSYPRQFIDRYFKKRFLFSQPIYQPRKAYLEKIRVYQLEIKDNNSYEN